MVNLPRLLTIMLFFALSIASAKAAVCTNQTVADNFNSVSSSQNNGTQNWTSNWLEIGENDGPSSGIARVNSSNCSSGNCLRIGQPSTASSWVNRGAQREANLSSATAATLTFNYFTGYAQGTQSVTLDISSDGGNNWTTLQTYNINGTNFSATTQSFDISSYKAANTRIRFLSNGNNARTGLYIDDIQINYTGTCTPSAPSTEWRLDESSWNGTANEIKDSVGSLHGTAFSASTVNGQVCKAGDLSSNSTSDYLSMDSSALNNVTDFSISVWGKTSNTGSQALFSASSGSQHNELIMWFPNSSTFTPFLKGNGSGSISITNIADNNWHHFTWTRDGAQNCFYIDGVLQGCSTKSSQALSVAAGGLIIGQEQDSLAGSFALNQDWEGLVDEPLIFKSVLSQAEITAIFNNQSAGNGWDGSARSCPSLVAEWRMNELLWAGTAGEINDATGNGHNATAINSLTNTDTSPALTGNPGTCGYGDFDGSNDYIELPASLPNLSGSFTIAGWINARDLGNDQRIFVDDESNNGGFAFSLGDGGNGKLRFFSRAVSPVVVDTQSAVIGQNTWHFVAAVHDASAKTRQIFVDGVAVTLNNGNSISTYTGNWGNDSGRASIGGETNSAGGEATANWRFNGLIDQITVHQGALSGAEISQLMNERQPCPGIPRAEWRFDEASWDGTPNEILDSGANNYHGRAFNSTPTAGLVCNAADLTTNSTTDYLSLNSGAFNGVGDFTLSLWTSTSNGSGQHTIVSGSSGFQHNELIMFFSNSSTFTPYLKGSGSGGSISIPNIADAQWHHYVWTRSGAQNCLYRDGISQGCVNRSTATLSIAAGGLIIGQEQDSLGGSFAISQDWEGLIDEMILFDGALTVPEIQSIYNNNLAGNNWNGAPRNCGAALDHLSLNHSGSAFTCAAEPVDVIAHRSDHVVDTSYLQTVNLSTSTNRGDWSLISGSGTLNNATANDGAASYTFVAGDSGSVRLGLKNSTFETLNINASDGSISETSGTALASEDQNLTFNETGFRFLANSTANAIGVQISDKDSDTGPGSQTLELQAIRTSPVTGACEAVLVNNNNIDLAFECLNPTSCTSSGVAINGTDIGANNNGPISTYLPVALDFGSAIDTTATFKLNYPDAGQIRLHARYNIPLGNGSASGNFMVGTSNSFVVKPAGLCVEATEANSSCSAGNVSCSAFKKAGEFFNLRITGVGWQTSGESHADFCTGNSATPNFQLNSLTLASNLVAPSPGTNANLGITSFNVVAADNGIHNITNQSVSEVGVFTLTATPPSYLGETIAASNSANIGRFIPDHFGVSAGAITEACNAGGFSYLGQNFTASYLLTAKNTAGTTTSNYRNSFIRLSPSLGAQAFGAIDSSGTTLLSSRLAQVGASSFSWNNNGTGTVTSTLNLARQDTGIPGNSVVDGPFAAKIGVLPSDADGVTVQLSDRNLDTNNSAPNDHVKISTSNQRFGRIVIDNAFGPEVLDLKVPLRAEFWNGSAFITNTNDSACPGSQFIVGDFTISDADGSDSLTPADLSSVTYQALVMGTGSLTLGAPNKSGPLNINLNAPNWLKYDFDGNASDDTPTAQAFFGQYRGNDRIIYWREQFE
jgi:MSHA biogenesis protein MshQ